MEQQNQLDPELKQRVDFNNPILSNRIKRNRSKEKRDFSRDFIAKTNMIRTVSKEKLYRDKSAPTLIKK
jgi:hypothetical protein